VSSLLIEHQLQCLTSPPHYVTVKKISRTGYLQFTELLHQLPLFTELINF